MTRMQHFAFIAATALFAVAFYFFAVALMDGHKYVSVQGSEREANARKYHECIRERYPTLTHSAFGGYVDERTGTRYNIYGTQQHNVCRLRVYGQ